MLGSTWGPPISENYHTHLEAASHVSGLQIPSVESCACIASLRKLAKGALLCFRPQDVCEKSFQKADACAFIRPGLCCIEFKDFLEGTNLLAVHSFVALPGLAERWSFTIQGLFCV